MKGGVQAIASLGLGGRLARVATLLFHSRAASDDRAARVESQSLLPVPPLSALLFIYFIQLFSRFLSR